MASAAAAAHATAESILAHLRVVEGERQQRAREPLLQRAVATVKAFQQRRFAHTYADLLSSSRYGSASRFFLEELYGPSDFTRRDAQFARVVPALARLFPTEVVQTVAALAELHALSERLDTVLQVIYLVFSEGYFASSGASVIRADLTGEAIRLTRLLRQLLPEPEVSGLLAMMLLHESRRDARTDARGNMVLLDDQDRSRWDRHLIAEGNDLVEEALRSRRFGSYSVQAAISAVHATSPSAAATDWVEIVALYDVLLSLTPSPVVELNRAVAVAMRDGAPSGLILIDQIFARGDLLEYPLAWSTHAELLRRSGEHERALASYRKALDLSQQEPARRFLENRIDDLRKTIAA